MSHQRRLNFGSSNWPTGHSSTLCTSPSHHHHPMANSLCEFPKAARVSFHRQLVSRCKAGPNLQAWEKSQTPAFNTAWGKEKGGCQHLAWLFKIKRKHTGLRILPQEGARSVEQMDKHRRSKKASKSLAGLTEGISLLKSLSGCYFKGKDRKKDFKEHEKIKET